MKKLSKEAFDRIKADFDYAKTYTNGRMLPEKTLELFRHISALEEDLAEKDAEISRLTEKVKAAEEVVKARKAMQSVRSTSWGNGQASETSFKDSDIAKLETAISAYEKIGG